MFDRPPLLEEPFAQTLSGKRFQEAVFLPSFGYKLVNALRSRRFTVAMLQPNTGVSSNLHLTSSVSTEPPTGTSASTTKMLVFIMNLQMTLKLLYSELSGSCPLPFFQAPPALSQNHAKGCCSRPICFLPSNAMSY